MITNKLKSASDSWKLSYEDAVNMMKEELEEAREEYSRLSDDAIDVYERMNDARKSLAQDWKKIQRKIHF